MNNHRNNRLLLLAGMALILVILPLVVSGCIFPIPLGSGPVPVDVVMVDNELFFVLEKETEFSALSVVALDPNAGEAPKDEWKPMWYLCHEKTEGGEREYPRVKQIKYGQIFEEFTWVIGPFELQRNVEYSVYIPMGPHWAEETFIITSDNKVIMPHPQFVRQNTRTYSVTIDENGNKILVPEPISNGEAEGKTQ